MQKLNHKSFGKGEPVIIIHGLMGMLDNWKTFARKLSEDYEVFILDMRNHGRSPWTEEMNYELMAADIAKFCDDNLLDEAFVIGHSMGGKVAMQFLFDHPEKVKKVVSVDIAPKEYVGNHQEIFDALMGLDLKNLSDRNEIDEQLSKKIEEYGVRQFLMKNLSRNPEGGFKFKMNLDAIYKNYDAILEDVIGHSQKEILFVNGANSNYINEEDHDLIESQFFNAFYLTIENAGHWVHAEQPKKLMEAVLEFFEN